MKLSNMVKRESVLCIQGAPDKWGVIRQMIDALDQTPFVLELPETLRSTFFAEIERREQLGSTGLGEGIALPHARINGLERPLIAFATVKDGVDFDAPDGLPAQLIFLILLPASRADLGVKINSACSRFLMQPDIRAELLQADGPDHLLTIMKKADLEIDTPITALDLMRPQRVTLSPDQAFEEATQLMHRSRTVAAPVLDPERRIIGEVNCNTLFQRELPDYIRQLHSVPHIADFSPFHGYFSHGKNLTVNDVMNPCESMIQPEGSLLEIIFLLSVKKHPLLYVCRGEQLVGVIDPITVMDKIINL